MNKIIAVLFAVFAGASFADEVARSSRGAQSEVRIQRTDNVRDSKTEASRVAVKNSVVEQTSAVRTTRGGAAETRTQKSETRNPQIGASVVAPTRAAATRAVLHTNSTSENAQSGSGRGVVSSGAGSARSISRSSTQSLRSSGVEADGRAVVGRGNSVTGSDIEGDIERKTMRRVARAATDNPFLAEAVSVETPSAAGELADCSVAYFECLDQFCNVLDANQKQCSCSGRLEQYKKVEDSLTKATEELNNVAQQIRYVGLSADEVRSILKETEAEEVLSSLEDKTQSRNMLEEIEKIIKDPDSGFSSSSNMTLDFELDFSGSSSDFDLGSMFGNNESFANMRGTELYSAAKKKCSAILSRCAPKKADQSIISGQYDIEIDKTCVAYEAGLKKATSNVRTNIKSATSMLQKARLAVMADQNSYDARGCVSALDTCMRDEMVCGSNYYKCLDPTKVAIDENGSVVPGGDVVSIRNLMSSYSAVKLDELLSNPTCSLDEDNHNGCKVVNYLKSKIGVMENGRIKSGFCRPVLEKCRLATYEEGQYIENNTVVKSYLERTMTQVNAAQNSIISEYAKSCVSDVSTCYNNQITQVNSYAGGTSLSPSVLKPILMGACRNVALSCAYAVFSEIDTGGLLSKASLGNTSSYCRWKCSDCDESVQNSSGTNPTKCIDKLSEMFYQSMLCPANSTWDDNSNNSISGNYKMTTDSTINSGRAYVNSSCYCNQGYVVYNGICTISPTCPTNSSHTDESTISPSHIIGGVTVPYCKCDEKYYAFNNTCTLTQTCPANSQFVSDSDPATEPVEKGVVVPHCQCKEGFYNSGTTCTACATTPTCPSGKSWNSTKCMCEQP